MFAIHRIATQFVGPSRASICMAQAAGVGEATHVADSIRSVVSRIAAAAERAGTSRAVRLVAVSKTKPVELLQEAYDAGQRDFGENYVQELVEKAPQLPEDIRWHFIGHLQTNKVKTLIEGVPNLVTVETVDSEKINTSGEESKHGVDPSAAVTLAQHIVGQCKNLQLAGLMTIGQPDYSSRPENFECLVKCREEVESALGLPGASLELSMGMSADFEQAGPSARDLVIMFSRFENWVVSDFVESNTGKARG